MYVFVVVLIAVLIISTVTGGRRVKPYETTKARRRGVMSAFNIHRPPLITVPKSVVRILYAATVLIVLVVVVVAVTEEGGN